MSKAVVPKGGLIIDCRETQILLRKEVMVEDVCAIVATTFQNNLLLGVLHIAASGSISPLYWPIWQLVGWKLRYLYQTLSLRQTNALRLDNNCV